MPYLFMVPKYHEELFGNSESVSIPYMIRVLFDIWKDKRQPDLTHAFEKASTEKKEEFSRKYVERFEILSLIGIADDEHLEMSRYSNVLYSIKEEGIKVPLLISANGKKRILEGHHRAGIARILHMKEVPGFLILEAGGKGTGAKNVTEFEEKLIEKEQEKNGLLPCGDYIRNS